MPNSKNANANLNENPATHCGGVCNCDNCSCGCEKNACDCSERHCQCGCGRAGQRR
jgi:hypothetical protein